MSAPPSPKKAPQVQVNELGYPIPQLISVRPLDPAQEVDDEPRPRHDIATPSEMQTPHKSASASAPTILVIPSQLPKEDEDDQRIPSCKFSVWLNTSGSIEYAYCRGESWTPPTRSRFLTKTVVAAPVAARLNGEIFVSWVEKERGIQVAKLEDADSDTTIAPYDMDMRTGIAMVADAVNSRLVVAWVQDENIRISTVDAAGQVSTPIAVVRHRGSFSMDIWKDKLYIITGGNRVTLFVIDANTFAEIEALDTDYKSQGAIRLAICGTVRPRWVLAWADTAGKLNMRILNGLTPGDLEPCLATCHNGISIQSSPCLALDEETCTTHLSWITVNGTMTYAVTGLGQSGTDWPSDSLNLAPFIFNTMATGTWYFSLLLQGQQNGKSAPKMRCCIGPPGGPFTCYLFSANLSFQTTTLTTWQVYCTWLRSGQSVYQNCPLGFYNNNPNTWTFYNTSDLSGFKCTVQISNYSTSSSSALKGIQSKSAAE